MSNAAPWSALPAHARRMADPTTTGRAAPAITDRTEPRPSARAADPAAAELDLLRQLAGRLSLATLVVDRSRRIRSGNAPGRALLEARDLLARSGDRLTPVELGAQAAFRTEVALQAEGSPERLNESTMILRSRADGRAVPVTLSRVTSGGVATGLVAVTVPRPPSHGAIRAVARLHGLSRSEARIAELMHRGLSNRQMAEATGFSEQTAKTYAKRILHKLDVSRCELVHLLTWQAEGRAEDAWSGDAPRGEAP